MTERPRKVQAPKVRHSERAPRGEGSDSRQRLILYAVAASGLLALAIVLVIVLTAGGAGAATASDARAALEKAGCSFQASQASTAGNHIADVNAKVTPPYATFPPTSGPHVNSPAPWGVYDDPVNQKILVHNLEHGGIIIQYGSKVPAGTKDELGAFFNDSPNGIVVAPLPALGDKIALGAWTAEPIAQGEKQKPGTAYLAKCTRYDAKGFEAFRDAFRYKGPERIPPDLMQPGQ